MRPIDKFFNGLLHAARRLEEIAKPQENWTPSPADLVSVLAAFVKGTKEYG